MDGDMKIGTCYCECSARKRFWVKSSVNPLCEL